MSNRKEKIDSKKTINFFINCIDEYDLASYAIVLEAILRIYLPIFVHSRPELGDEIWNLLSKIQHEFGSEIYQ